MSVPGTTLCITAVEAVTPLGFDAEQSFAAVRARANRFADHPFHVCLVGDPDTQEAEPLVASILPEIDPELEGEARLQELALPAFKAILAKAGFKRADLTKGGLLLSLPPAEPDKGAPSRSDFAATLLARLGIGPLKVVQVCRTGHTGMATCLSKAATSLIAGEAEFFLVAGLESYHLASRLQTLDEAWRLKSQRALDGFMPGEAAVIFLVETLAHAAARKAKPLATVTGIGFGKEAKHHGSDALSTGEGLTAALLPVLSMPRAKDAGGRWLLCDMNGESYRAAEWGLVRARLGESLDPMVGLTYPADCLGDTGAASGGVSIAYALHAFARGFAPAEEALVWNASEDGGRSALLVRKAQV